MGNPLFKQLEAFRRQKGLSILALCRQMGIHNHTYHRWKKSGKITGSYKRLISVLLSSKKSLPFSATAQQASNRPPLNSDIAVIGISCYYPGASNVRELWENILARRVQFRRMLDQRLPLGEYYDENPKAPEKTYLTKAAFLENFQFDWAKLRIPKKTVESTDIAHWLALDTALKTFEDAGYKLSEIPLQNTGVIVGNTLTGEQTRSQTLRLRWPYVQKALNATLEHLGKSIEESSQIASEMERIYKSAFYPVTEDSLAGGLANTIAGRICNYLNLKGGGYIVDGACSSSLLAVATAADALKMGHMDLVLAGGVDISLDPFELVGFAKAGALAKDQMRVYDQKANGFLPGEGCGFVLLKRLNDAIRDKNYVYAVIKGWGISSDGRGGIMEPSSSGQSFAIGRAYKDLAYKISDVNFVEGHGTGTTKGDRVELEGIANAIDKTVRKEDLKRRVCGVTSFKSIVGHTKAAAGVGGFIKAVLAVNQRILPPTANCTHPNEVFQDKARYLYPIIQGAKLPQDQIARAGISSAGFGGINCHITVESKDEPKKELKPKLDEGALFASHQETEVFVFTSRTIVHLEKIIQKFKEDLRNISIAEMADLAAFLNKKSKDRLPIKAAIVTDSPEHLYEALVCIEQEIQNVQLEEGIVYRVKPVDPLTSIILSNNVKKCRVGFLYPGQGSQRLNMTRRIVERYPWAKDLFKISQLPLVNSIYVPVEKYLTREEQQEFEKQLSDTRITQPAIVLSSLIWTEFLSKLGIEPQSCVGHSLGELMAFYKAGALNKESLIKFAQLRGKLMASHNRLSGSMVSLFCSKDKAEALINKISGNIVIANINSPLQIVVSGAKKEIERIKELAKKENISAYPLNVSNAFHSPLMKEPSDKIKKAKILPDKYRSNGTKIYSCVTGEVVGGQVNLKDYFSKQVVSPVNFVGAVKSACVECDLMIEVGPGKVLTDLVKAINKEIPCLPVESFAGNDRDLNIVLAELFVRNGAVKFEELYKNRLIKTFVPASRKKFIENQCERPLKIGNEVLKGRFLPVLLQVKEEADQLEEIIPGGLPEANGKDHIADLLVNLTHDITGFDRESISLNLRLLDDLNLDSIKAAELIGQAARNLGIAGQIDPSLLSNNTLGQIRDRLDELLSTAGPIKESASDILKRYLDKTWVRNFILDLKPEEIKTKNVNQLKGLKDIVFVSGRNEASLVDTIENELKIIKVKTQRIYFGDHKQKTEKGKHIDCLITILPKETSNNELGKASLKSIIEQLHQMTEFANSHRLDKDSFVVFVQFGGGDFGENKALRDIASCCAKSLASTLFLERPDLKVRIIDFDAGTDENKISQRIIDELQTYEAFSAVGYDAQLVRKAVYYENSYPVDYKGRNISWSKRDVVLVTGGAKGITAQCALEFARLTKAQMVLIGRSPVPENKDDTNEIVQTLRSFEKENLNARYYRCDVSDEKDVTGTISEIEKKIGKITGIIHGAGLNSLKRLKQINVQDVFQEALPKVIGAVNICRALENHPPKLIVGITSIIGLTGMEASGWYGLSNEILNLYLHQFRNQHPQTDVVTIAYSIWDEVGMGKKLGSVSRLAEKGIGAIPVSEGIKHFRQLVEGDPGTQQVIVAARIAGIATWRSHELKPNNFRFLEKIEYVLPGVELIARANLNVTDDSYLLDHNWKGSLLFPFVFGFEAMAQAVAYVLGIEEFDYIQARDINLQRPISVPQESGTTIEIHAQVLDQEKRDGHLEVKVEIYSQESAYKEPHFSTIFKISGVIARSEAQRQSLSSTVIPASSIVIPAKAGIHYRIDPHIQQKAKNVIDLDLQTDIYGPILFQGKLFQCIDQIHELYYDEKTKKGECIFTSIYNKSVGEFHRENKKFNRKFLIGDPFFIDSLLQSMQVMIPQDLSLPRDIKEIKLKSVRNKENLKYLAQSKIERIDNDYYKCDAQVNSDQFILDIKDCRLKVLDIIFSNPTANELANPSKQKQNILEAKLETLSKEIGFSFPVIRCLYNEGLRNFNKEQRHKIEVPIIKDAIEELLRRNKIFIKNFGIRWLKSGKPEVIGKGVKDISISVSHNESFLIVVAGHGEQGCDVQFIDNKSSIEWMDLLGKEKFKILENFLSDKNLNENINKYGTAYWSALEVIKKLYNINNPLLETEEIGDVIVFRSNNLQRNSIIITLPIKITKNSKAILALMVCEEKDTKIFKKLGYKDNLFMTNIDFSGPQGQAVYVQRFPVTFKNTQSLNKSVYFSNYFDWIGAIREYSLYPVKEELTQLFETGKWGMTTNYVKLHIRGELKTDDVVESRFWIHRVFGDKNSVLDLMYDWLKVLPDGEYERVATSEQRVSWMQITGHGEGKIEVFPESIRKFIHIFQPQKESLNSLPLHRELFTNLNTGKEIIASKGISRANFFLTEEVFSTSLEESNLVGNIYFSNYAKWLGKVRDNYFRELMQEHYLDQRNNGEFICLDCEVHHLMEAMPFDKINIKMYLNRLWEYSADFYFEFFKISNGQEVNKLAYATHKVIFGKVKKGHFVPDILPIKNFYKISKNSELVIR